MSSIYADFGYRGCQREGNARGLTYFYNSSSLELQGYKISKRIKNFRVYHFSTCNNYFQAKKFP